MTVLIGNDVSTTTESQFSPDSLGARVFTAVATGTAEELVFNTSRVGRNVKVALYDSSDDLLSSGEVTGTVDGDNTVTLSPQVAVTNGVDYRIGILPNDFTEIRREATSETWGFDNTTYASGPPDPFAQDSSANVQKVRIFVQGTTLTVPVITDVDTDEIITATQANVVTTGTGFKATQSTGKIELSSGSILSEQTVDSWSDTSIQADTVQGNIPFTDTNQTVSMKVTNSDAQSDALTITLNPDSGRSLVTALSVDNTNDSLYGLMSGGTAVDTDQLDVPTLSDNGYTVTYNADGTFSIASMGDTSSDQLSNVRWWSSASETWSAAQDINIGSGAAKTTNKLRIAIGVGI
jgi:hypothetical protein